MVHAGMACPQQMVVYAGMACQQLEYKNLLGSRGQMLGFIAVVLWMLLQPLDVLLGLDDEIGCGWVTCHSALT